MRTVLILALLCGAANAGETVETASAPAEYMKSFPVNNTQEQIAISHGDLVAYVKNEREEREQSLKSVDKSIDIARSLIRISRNPAEFSALKKRLPELDLSVLKENLPKLDQLKTGLKDGTIVDLFPLPMTQLETGMIGGFETSRSEFFKRVYDCIQVVDATQEIIRMRIKVGDEFFGKEKLFWLSGVSTKDVVKGTILEFKSLFVALGTKTYTPESGTPQTLWRLQKLDDETIAKIDLLRLIQRE